MCTNTIHEVIKSMSEAFDLSVWSAWFAQLDRTFIFLLVLPLVVAVVGLWAAYRDREVERRQRDETAPDRASTVERRQTRTHGPRVSSQRYN